jgi:hypothetical protein
VDVTPPPIDNAATERITPKQVQRGWRVDSTPPHIDCPTTPPQKGLFQSEFEGGGVWISHRPVTTMSLQKKIYPPMRGFNEVEGAACRYWISYRPVVDIGATGAAVGITLPCAGVLPMQMDLQ